MTPAMTPEQWQRLKALFGEALELGGDQRRAFIDKSCGADAQLRSELEGLLRSSETGDAFLATPTVERPEQDRPALALPAAGGPPAVIGAYTLVRELGHGGMGTVFLGERTDRAFEKKVAIKVIRRGMDSEFVVDRFRTERRILASLQHPNIAALLDGGQTEAGLPYFVLEYVEGEPIDRACELRGLSVRQRLELFLQVCSAVQHAHANLVVHRDLKPGNVLVTKEGAPKLLDFGLARLLDPQAASAEQTAAPFRFLTPAYASPEQIQGRPITTSTDVYSLGVILYQLLTGQRPHGAPESSFTELSRAVCEDQPRPPSEVVPRGELKRRLAGDLDTIVLKALRKEPERRYRTVEQLASDLRLHLEGRPITARPSSALYSLGKLVARNKLGTALVAAVVVLLAGAFVETLRARANAERRFNDVRRLANSFLFEFDDAIKDVAGALPARQLVVKRAQEYLDVLAQEAPRDPRLKAELATAYERLGVIQGSGNSGTGDVVAAGANLHKALALREELLKEWPDAPGAKQALAKVLEELGHVRDEPSDLQAGGYIQRAMALQEELAAAAPRDWAAQFNLGSTTLSAGLALSTARKYREALEVHRRALACFERAEALGAPALRVRRNLSLSNKYIGGLLERLGEHEKATPLYLRAIELDEAHVAAEPDSAEARLDLSFSYASLGFNLLKAKKYDESLVRYRQALALREKMVALDKADSFARSAVAKAHRSIGRVYLDAGRHPEALQEMATAVALAEALQRDRPDSLRARTTVASYTSDEGDVELAMARKATTPVAERASHYRAARALYVRALEIYGRIPTEKLLPDELHNVDECKELIAAGDAELAKLAPSAAR